MTINQLLILVRTHKYPIPITECNNGLQYLVEKKYIIDAANKTVWICTDKGNRYVEQCLCEETITSNIDEARLIENLKNKVENAKLIIIQEISKCLKS